MLDYARKLRDLLAAGALELPLPGGGATRARYFALREFGRSDLSLARLAEAHTDAVAILAEVGRTPQPRALYGVWASEGPGSRVELTRDASGGRLLNGTKRYCSGAPFLDRALISAHGEEGALLIELELDAPGVRIQPSEWATPAFAATQTSTLSLDSVRTRRESVVHTQDGYVKRAGFWHGALGPAACWAGGAAGLAEAAWARGGDDAHIKAQLGALAADDWAMSAILSEAAREIDADPRDARCAARTRALKVRHMIERLCTDVIDRFGRATGPQLLAFDADIARRHAELSLYLLQCHAERDLELLTTSIREAGERARGDAGDAGEFGEVGSVSSNERSSIS